MRAEAIARSYARWAPVYDLAFGRITSGGRRLAAAHVNRIGGSVLEVGIGTGLALDWYDRRIAVTGIDLSEAMLAKAEAKVRSGRHPNVRGLHRMDARRLAFPDRSFDHVAAMHVMSVVPEPERVLAEMTRVCRIGGHVLIASHFARDRGGWSVAERIAAPLADRLGWHSDFPKHRVMGEPCLRLEDEVGVPPFGLMTFLRFRRAG